MKYKVLDVDFNIYKLGVYLDDKKLYAKVESNAKKLALLFYKRNEKDYFLKLDFDENKKVGNIWFLAIEFSKRLEKDIEYNFISDNEKIFEDKYGKVFSGNDSFAKVKSNEYIVLRTKLIREKFVCDFLEKPNIPLNKNVIYRLNIRTFTKSNSSKVIHKGTFKGVLEKIDYIKYLGINAILLMPSYEFFEVRKDKKINIWGYERARHFAPKASFCTKKNRNPELEYKEFIESFHKENIEVWQEFYFENEGLNYILDVLEYYVSTYKIDGIYINAKIDSNIILQSKALSDTKIILNSSYNINIPKFRKAGILELNDDFQNGMRKFIKGDEGVLYQSFENIKSNPNIKKIKYLANIQGFSLIDVFSYDRKHNENNGEENKDGTNYNYSWNCGIEGDTKKKSILNLREKLYKNALVIGILSFGVPMITAGDEFGDTRFGNNNSYCQDNEVSYLDFKKANKYKLRIEFIKKLIKFRNKYSCFSLDKEFNMYDTISCGMPDLSVHGKEFWKAEFNVYNKEMALYYSGKYYKDENGVPENDIYIIYNMNYIKQKFYLPHIDKSRNIYKIFDTNDEYKKMSILNSTDEMLNNREYIELEERSIVCLLIS